jgi:homopolymeric O-antigen transport system ATP-binding protein
VVNQRYDTLCDRLTDGLKGLFQRHGRLFPPNAVIWALKDVSLEVKQGAVVGNIGRDGTGKSALLKMLTPIMQPTTGLTEFYGRVGSLLEVGTGSHFLEVGTSSHFLWVFQVFSSPLARFPVPLAASD